MQSRHLVQFDDVAGIHLLEEAMLVSGDGALFDADIGRDIFQPLAFQDLPQYLLLAPREAQEGIRLSGCTGFGVCSIHGPVLLYQLALEYLSTQHRLYCI